MAKKLKYLSTIIILIGFWSATNGPLELIHKWECDHHDREESENHRKSEPANKHHSQQCVTCFYFVSFLKNWSDDSLGFCVDFDDIEFETLYFAVCHPQDFHLSSYPARAPPSV